MAEVTTTTTTTFSPFYSRESSAVLHRLSRQKAVMKQESEEGDCECYVLREQRISSIMTLESLLENNLSLWTLLRKVVPVAEEKQRPKRTVKRKDEKDVTLSTNFCLVRGS